MNAVIDRPQARTEEIRFAFGTFSLGLVLVAASAKGVAAILIGDELEALHRDLENAFPSARLRVEEARLEDTVTKVIALLEAPQNEFGLPLDVRGTALERAVWQALRAIPAGQTITYAQLAKALPLSATPQEVGLACAANVLAVAIPCHRVIKADGAISGYRWGVRRKRQLLRREGVATPARPGERNGAARSIDEKYPCRA